LEVESTERYGSMHRILTALILALALTAASCGGDDDGALRIELSDSSLGEIVTTGEGDTLYLFIPDGQGESVCYDDCEATWPPLVVDVVAGDGVDEGLIGSTERTDGTTQVTYNGWPLYYFAGDSAAGDTNGQGINDIWYVIDAAGDAVN
jgi:predicted lipoprotein with Yx(FWY)xxD motif